MTISSDVAHFLSSPQRRFADPFLSADPSGSRAVTSQELREALPRRQAMFAAAGAGPLTLVHAEESRLDDLYLLVRTTWTATTPDTPVELHATYLLRRVEPDYEIVLYLNHEDLADVLRPRTPG